MTDSLHHDKLSDDDFFLHEAVIVWNIALNDAFAMGQLPGVVHLAGASLYRLRNTDPEMAKDLRITVNDIREWATANLSAKGPSRKRYEGDLDFEYTVALTDNMLTVRPVRKPANIATFSYPDHVHPPGEGGVVRRSDPAENKLQTESMESLFQFVEPFHADSEAAGNSATTVRRILVATLATAEVQTCLKDIGVSIDELRSKLGEPFGQ